MNRPAAALMFAAALAIPGCAAPPHDPADLSRVPTPDTETIDRVLDSPEATQLAASFLRSQHPPATIEDPRPFHRMGTQILVYATNPNFATDPQSLLEKAGTPSYIAVPATLTPRTTPDTIQLTPTPPYTPQAIATGTEESQAAQSLPETARLLLDYPSHTWFAWTQTRVTTISSSTNPTLNGQQFDANQFKQWLASR
ncbi:hypothetical protein ACFYO1_06160 [Nocardia sp. NPDC006044]|uniref:hypothetical protein n=1 Tax=Nocardia sp. NPDC006044 TaxID=3364306 RepID=UPI00367B8628